MSDEANNDEDDLGAGSTLHGDPSAIFQPPSQSQHQFQTEPETVPETASSSSGENLDYGQTLKGLRKGLKTFGRYSLLRQIGRGGMGVVWLGQDERLNREVALKFLPGAVQGDAAALDDLREETKRCLELTHSNIVRIHDLVEDQQAAAIVMEYVEGETLSKLRVGKPNKVFEAAEITDWIEQSCEALNYAHGRKIVHRDLKPSNLMSDADGTLRMLDFGIAGNLTDSMSRLTSGSVKVSGTLPYMSPQQASGYPPSVSDDIYALGATIYELLTGKPPFYSGNIQHQIETTEVPSITERRKEFGMDIAEIGKIPREWEVVVASCLAKDPEERPESAEALWLELSGGVAPGYSAKRAKRRKKRGGAAKKAMALAVAVILMGGGVAGWWYGMEVPKREQAALEKFEAQQEADREAAKKAQAAALLVTQQEEDRKKAQAAAKLESETMATQEAQRAAQVTSLLDSVAEAGGDELKKKGIYENVLKLDPVNVKALRELGRIDALRGRVDIKTVPEGATLRLIGATGSEKEGEEVGNGMSPQRMEGLALGKYQLEIQSPGFDPVTREVSMLNGELAMVDITLKRSRGSLMISPVLEGMTFEISRVSSEVEAYDGVFAVITGAAPARVPELPTGEYEVVMKQNGWLSYKKTYEVKRDDKVEVVGDFVQGTMKVESKPTGAEVTGPDGASLGKTPLNLKVPAGEHALKFKLANYKERQEQVKVMENQIVSTTVQLERIPAPKSSSKSTRTTSTRPKTPSPPPKSKSISVDEFLRKAREQRNK